MRNNDTANFLIQLNKDNKIYDKYWDQCLVMPDMIIATNERS